MIETSIGAQVEWSDLGIWFGKTSPEPSVVTEEKTSKPSSRKSSVSQKNAPMCLCLTKGDGQKPDACMTWAESGLLHGAYTTRSFGESPKEENASRLSQILEAYPHPKYCLSAKACRGILTRAKRRGKVLPPPLKIALEQQSASRNAPDAPGGGKGILIQDERAGALSTLNNQSVCYGISAYASNAMLSDNPHSGIYEADTARTLDNNGGTPACNQGGMIVLEGNGSRESHKGDGYAESETMYTLNGTERHAVCAGFKAGNGPKAHGIGYEEEMSPTLSSSPSGGNLAPAILDARGNGDGQTAPTAVVQANGNCFGSVVPTLVGDHQDRVTDYTTLALDPVVLDSNQNHASAHQDGVTNALPASAGMGGGYVPMVAGPLMASGYAKNGTQEAMNGMYVAQNWDGADVAPTLTANNAGGSQRMPDKGNFNAVISYAPDIAHALKGKANCQYREDSETYISAVDCRNGTENADVNGTLQAKEQGQNLNSNNVCRCGSVVRRLTPTECERLQGFPDGWTDIGEWVDSKGKKHKEADSPRHKALGNSIAVGYANEQSGFWCWMARRICAQYERRVTMASLFDGIGGFPLAFSACGAVPVWASEIEEFPIAVTKIRFPEKEEGT